LQKFPIASTISTSARLDCIEQATADDDGSDDALIRLAPQGAMAA
jgi:hypothetical protein